MVAEAAENAEWRLESRKRSYHRSLCCVIPGQEVAGQRHQVPLQLVRDSNVPANFLGAHEGADVEIGKLDNAETFERLRQAAEADPLMGGFEVKPAIEESVAAGNKRGSAQGNGSLLQESPPARGLQIRPRRYELLESPTHRTCDVIDRAQQYCDQEFKERTHHNQSGASSKAARRVNPEPLLLSVFQVNRLKTSKKR